MKPARSLSILVTDRTSWPASNENASSNSGSSSNNDDHNDLNEATKKNSDQDKRPTNNHEYLSKQQLQLASSGKLHSQYSMPCHLNSRRATEATYQIHHSMFDEEIVFSQLSIAAKKDFNEEVRALLDVRKFVTDSMILLDMQEIRICTIVEAVVDRLVDCRQLDDAVAEEAKSLLFVERNSLNMVLANTMQGLYKSRADGRLAYDHSWLVAVCSLSSLTKRQVAITRFSQPVNFGRQSQEVRFLIIVLAPSKEKLTKSAWETGRTFATMFADIDFRRRLIRAKGQDEFKAELLVKAEMLARQGDDNSFDQIDYQISCKYNQSGASVGRSTSSNKLVPFHQFHNQAKKQQQQQAPCEPKGCCGGFRLASGLIDDLKRRASYYVSDYTDGFATSRDIYKTISTTIFLYFSVLLPCIAFGVVDTNNTEGHIDPKKTMIGQAVGGLLFAIFSGQPLVVVMTTAPLCIYVKVIYQIGQDLEVDFGTFYACVGLWMCFFLIVMSLTNASNLMKYCTRSTEDIFALFTAFAFGSDGIKEAVRSFNKYYWDPDCAHSPAQSRMDLLGPHQADYLHNLTSASSQLLSVDQHQSAQVASSTPSEFLPVHSRCQRETCIMFLFLMSGTLFLANSFNAFNETPYLSSRKREIIKDYALAISVLIFSFVGSCLFADIRLDVFEFGEFTGLHLAQMSQLSGKVMLAGCLLGFMLAVLFYIDQNICGAMVNNSPYKLKKGDYFHLDLLVVALLNAALSLFGLPWMHGKLPHSHLHSKALADYEERVDDGHVHQTIVNIRETRCTGILVSLLISASLLAVPYPLAYIPLPVLSGVFLYTALAEFKSNSMVERVCLLFTEQAAYPPNHYIRRCPQRKIHFFTFAQLAQLAVVSFVGFYPNPYVNMSFPLVVATFVPIRELLLPKLIDLKYLQSLDSASIE